MIATIAELVAASGGGATRASGVLWSSVALARRRGALVLLSAAALVGCSRGPEAQDAPVRTDPLPPAAAADAADARPVILFVGTSLTAGLGVDPSAAYPALIQRRLDAEGLRYRAVNAGLSGETSAGALRRIDWLLRQPVAVLVLETGANDGMRGLDPAATRQNIERILARARSQQPPPRLVVVGMEAFPNYGEDYRARFRAVFAEAATKNDAAFVPFLLEGVGGVAALNQGDGIHPNAEGHARIAETVWKTLRPQL
jgi:acyl-CoA thioesterase-1